MVEERQREREREREGERERDYDEEIENCRKRPSISMAGDYSTSETKRHTDDKRQH